MRKLLLLSLFTFPLSIFAQITVLKDINSQDGNGLALRGITFNNKLYFDRSTPETGNELWVSDGTSDGTRLFKELTNGVEGSNPSNFVVFNGMLYFTVKNTSSETELWKTDGT